MSGRSAYVRKEKTKTKTTLASSGNSQSETTSNHSTTFSDFPMPMGHDRPYGLEEAPRKAAPARSVISDRSDDMSYARVRKPPTPIIDVSGIEKSSFREKMDKRSENVRKGLMGMSFGKKKKKKEEEQRPPTSATMRPSPVDEEPEMIPAFSPPPPPPSRTRTMPGNAEEALRSGPPLGKLPALPPPPQLKRWVGSGRPAQPWNKLRKDPELWDPHGDTLIFLGHETHQIARPPPSFRVSSHVLEATESRFFITILREGYTDFGNDAGPPSPDGGRQRNSRGRNGQPTPPGSETSAQDPDGEISYELYFPAPLNLSKTDSLRHHVTTRNVFALLYQASLVGLNMHQALEDLQERMITYMPPETDNVGLIIDYVTQKGLDDVRNDPHSAIALLAWSEKRSVHWQEGWRESFVHSTGMEHRLEEVPELRLVTPITRALLERASLEVQVRVHSVEERLMDFNFADMWPAMSAVPPPERSSFERLRYFLRGYYESVYGAWPVAGADGEEQWLTRGLVTDLQKDFGALYDYLVDRDVRWDCYEERSSRKWNIVSGNRKNFNADTMELPMTDILVAFDNRHRFPHIPHPYPLVPESMRESMQNRPRMAGATDKMAERKAALAYTESTNIYILGSEFVSNKLVDAFIRFEKMDKISETDPFAGRRGRWVLIYGILQVLASISVDAPAMRYKDGVTYHLSPRLRGTPPWKGADLHVAEAQHEGSHCWIVPRTWVEDSMPGLDMPRRFGGLTTSNSVRSSTAPSVSTESDAASSIRSPVRSMRRLKTPKPQPQVDHLGFGSMGYGPGITKVEEWPIREHSRSSSPTASNTALVIKDFDEYCKF